RGREDDPRRLERFPVPGRKPVRATRMLDVGDRGLRERVAEGSRQGEIPGADLEQPPRSGVEHCDRARDAVRLLPEEGFDTVRGVAPGAPLVPGAEACPEERGDAGLVESASRRHWASNRRIAR